MNPARREGQTISSARIQMLVFATVGAAFTTIYITQPVLPVIQAEFAVNATYASLTVSAVIFGIALANLPLGMVADRYPIKPIIFVGGTLITLCALVCAVTDNLSFLIGARFVQGLFIPCLSTCLVAYLSRTLPPESLNVAMGSYISATVAGGMGSRLLVGLFYPDLSWRYAFLAAAVLVAAATVAACRLLPEDSRDTRDELEPEGFRQLISRPALLRIYIVAFCAFFVFSSIFNYIPFYLEAPPLNASTSLITTMYLSYLIGMIIGPFAGKLSNRIGNGGTMALGSAVFAASMGITLFKSLPAIAASLVLVCAGFFAIHASAAGSLNSRLNSGRGRANSLYVLFYYLGGFAGISLSGYAFASFGWPGLIALGLTVLLVPFSIGVWDMAKSRGSL